MIDIASLVLFASDLEASAAFYRTIGVALDDEDHDDGPVHAAAEVGGVHFAIYQADEGVGARATGWRAATSIFPGFYVSSLDSVAEQLTKTGAQLLERHQARAWGCRIVAMDPDGHPIEINQRGHCA